MKKPEETFGDFIKLKRTEHEPKLTLKKASELTGINLTYLSDVENGRKPPFSAEKINIFCKKLGLSEEDRITMFDLAARDNESVPEDIIDTIMYTEEGDCARRALRMVNEGKGNIEIWKELIRKMEEQ